MFADIRDFTPRSEAMDPEKLVGLLNRYFECQVPAIDRHGGEVLKFIGDGLLAIFPINDAAPAAARYASSRGSLRNRSIFSSTASPISCSK